MSDTTGNKHDYVQRNRNKSDDRDAHHNQDSRCESPWAHNYNHVERDNPPLHNQDSVNNYQERNGHLEKAWIIGTSIVGKLDKGKMYRNKNRVNITTLRDKTISGAQDFVKSGKVKADVVLFQVGSNDLDTEEVDPEQVIENLEELVYTTRDALGEDTEITIREVLPRWYRNRQNTYAYQSKCAEFNDRLYYLGYKLGVSIIPQGNMSERFFYDGIHLIPNGIRVLVKHYKQVLNGLLGMNISYSHVGNSNGRPGLQDSYIDRGVDKLGSYPRSNQSTDAQKRASRFDHASIDNIVSSLVQALRESL